MSKMVMGQVKEVKVGVVNTHLGTWYSETEDRWSEVKINCKGNFISWLKVFIDSKLRQVTKGNFHRKATKWVKHQVKVSKMYNIRTKGQSTY